jgi:hypothetical protein
MPDKEMEKGKERNVENVKNNARCPRRRAARVGRSLLFHSGLQGAFRFFTLAHFERDSQRKSRSEHNPRGGWMYPVSHQECGERRNTETDSQHWSMCPPAVHRAIGAPSSACPSAVTLSDCCRGASAMLRTCRTVLHTPAERSVVAHGNGTRIERSHCNDMRYADCPPIRPISQDGTLRASPKARLQQRERRPASRICASPELSIW